MVVIVFGLPGSGKSYFASRLAGKLQAIYINTDKVRLEMAEARTYSDEEKLAVYNRMLEIANGTIARNKNAVIDGTFFKVQIRRDFLTRLHAGGLVRFIEITADDAVIRERLKRPREFSEADIEVYRKIKSQWEPMEEEHLVLQSTDSNIDEMLNRAMHYLTGQS